MDKASTRLIFPQVPEEYHRLMDEDFSGNLFERSDSSLSRCSNKSFDENLPLPPQNVENDETLDYTYHNVGQPASAQSLQNGYHKDNRDQNMNEDKLKDISYENEKSIKDMLSPLFSEAQPSYPCHPNKNAHQMRKMHPQSQENEELDYENALPVMKNRVLPHEPQESECDFTEPSTGYTQRQSPQSIQSVGSEGSSLSCPEEAKKYDKLTQFAYSVTPHFSYKEIVGATDGFADHNLQGKGTFGEVYKGTLRKTAFAIKRLLQQRQFEGEQARQRHHHMEIKSLLMYRHDNIVQLIGYSLDGPEVCLIYQFMVNGSLEDRLACKDGTKPLSWHQRCSILKGAARGLQYLHTALDKPLIHGDVKSANILLDKHYEARIGDFGIAQEAQKGSEGKYTHITQQDAGIFGSLAYAPPEFLRNYQLSVKGDTYGFGVVIFEACSGKPPFEEKEHKGRQMTKYLKDHMGEVLDMVNDDKELLKEKDHKAANWPDDIFVELMKLGHYCIMPKKKERPEMSEVLKSLEDVELNVQKEKYFQHRRSSKEDEKPASSHMSYEDTSRSFQMDHHSYVNPEKKLQEVPDYVNESSITKDADDPNFFYSDPKKLAEIEKFDQGNISHSADDERFLAYDKKKIGEDTVGGSTGGGPRSMSPLELQKQYDVAKEKETQSGNFVTAEKRPGLLRTYSPLQLQMSYDAMKQHGGAKSLDGHLQEKIEKKATENSVPTSLPAQPLKDGRKLEVEHYENIPVHHDYENIPNFSEIQFSQQGASQSPQPRQSTANCTPAETTNRSEMAVEEVMPRKKKLPKAFQQYYDEVAELQKEVENKDANVFFAGLEQSQNFRSQAVGDNPEYYNEVCLQMALQEHQESQSQIGDIQQFETRDTAVVQKEDSQQRDTDFAEKKSEILATDSTLAEAQSMEHIQEHVIKSGDKTAISQHHHYTSCITEYVADEGYVQNPALGLVHFQDPELGLECTQPRLGSPADIVENLRQRKEALMQSVQKDLPSVTEDMARMTVKTNTTNTP
ncbi:serine/threonine-protein kinase TAO2-like isoform X2 [Lingula anatina]|uniref:non-specific serine/threonine protein kinase n=1 Tax=Lingula anatina TaxID=7574 RepID=A0A1S3KFM8_LINAN|nr:serine/threonine-protein kinase TAO2-like isoform X2 [Lingula anatina]|eukprot:XP_013421264.1 serine/threonine-protein kinase TAO2-like isoform X2 [Lingula anatina]